MKKIYLFFNPVSLALALLFIAGGLNSQSVTCTYTSGMFDGEVSWQVVNKLPGGAIILSTIKWTLLDRFLYILFTISNSIKTI